MKTFLSFLLMACMSLTAFAQNFSFDPTNPTALVSRLKDMPKAQLDTALLALENLDKANFPLAVPGVSEKTMKAFKKAMVDYMVIIKDYLKDPNQDALAFARKAVLGSYDMQAIAKRMEFELEVSDLKKDYAAEEYETKKERKQARKELKAEIKELEDDMKEELADLKQEIKEQAEELKS